MKKRMKSKKIRKAKKEVFRVRNKPALALIIAMHFMVLLLALEVNSGIVSAVVTSSSYTTMTYSSSSSNPQYYKPGSSRSYSQQYAEDYWPILANPERCEASVDFIMNIRPGSCTPAVVRSDLLEEQNVPVFCKVDILKINPLIDVSQLKSVRFTKTSENPYVAGVSFHPNHAAIYSQKGFLDNPLINDVGYVVVLLKRIEAEKDMPDSIKVNLTGVLSYDAEGFFGAGKNTYYLNVLSEENWSEDYKENGFWKGKGYLRLDYFDDNKAGVSIYLDKEQRYQSVELEKGQTSRFVYILGFYCRAGLQVRLDGIEAGIKRVKLDVDGDETWLVEGERFLDNECRVVKIEDKPEKILISLKKEVSKITVNGKNSSELKVDGSWIKASFQYENELKTYALTENDELKFYNIKEDKGEIGWVNVVENNNDFNKNLINGLKNAREKETTAQQRSVKISCKGKTETLYYTPEEKEETPTSEDVNGKKETGEYKNAEDIDKDVKQNYEIAKGYADDIGKFYGGVATNNEVWAAKALYRLGVLARDIGMHADAVEIFHKVIQDYPNTAYAKSAESEIGNINAPSSDYKGHTIRLLQIEIPNKDDASANIRIIKEGSIFAEAVVQENEKFGEGKFELVKLEPDKVDLVYYYTKDGESAKTPFSLSYSDRDRKLGDYELVLQQINLKQIAKVSLISKMPQDYSEAEFAFEIGIEKRAIQLSPEKTKELILKLNNQIEKWSSIVEKLGNVVSVMKGACLATSSVLLVKNFFSNLGGGATARQKVMGVWYEKCEREYGSGKEKMEQCLSDNADPIEKDVQAYKKHIEQVNKQMIALQEANKKPGTELVDRNKVAAEMRKEFPDGMTYDSYVYDANGDVIQKIEGKKLELKDLNQASSTQLRDLLLYKKIADDASVSKQARQAANEKIDNIASKLDAKLEQGSQGYLEGNSLSWVNSKGVYYHGNGLVYEAPIPRVYEIGKNKKENGEKLITGFIVRVDREDYTAAGEPKKFTIENIGNNEKYIYTIDDNILQRDSNAEAFRGLGNAESQNLIRHAMQVIQSAKKDYRKSKANLLGVDVYINKAPANEKRCQDFMSPQDCKILFNVCDPVLCPASRCDLGGAYRVDNVVQSGIIGSIALCLPNFVGFGGDVVVPVCVSGIHAGLDAYTSILKAYRDCLKENLETGRTVGICDEIHSIYLCEFFWRQIGPYLDVLMYKLIEAGYGQGMKGGGEYLTVQDSWDNLHSSVAFIRDDYAVNANKAFLARSTGEAGGEFCKMFVSARFPNNKKFFDNLLQPDSPVQFHAWFDEIPYSEVTVPATSQYKVFYFIYSGKDEGASFQVYLKDPPVGGYVSVQDVIIVDTGYAPRGTEVSETRDFTAPAGYKQLCVRINGKDKCGFGKVSTSFALNYVSDAYYQEQITKPARTTEECISGSPSLSGVFTTPNIQEGVQASINPEIQKKGVVRVCSSNNPGGSDDSSLPVEERRWLEVGECDDEGVECWLDKVSVQEVIKNKNIEDEVVKAVSERQVSGIVDELGSMPQDEVERIFKDVKKNIDKLENELENSNTNLDAKKTMIAGILEGKNIEIINLKATIKALDEVENRAAMNPEKAEAVYYKFRIYEVITKSLHKAYNAQKEAEEEAGKKAEPVETETGAETKIVSFATCEGVCKETGYCDAENCHKKTTKDCFFSERKGGVGLCENCPTNPVAAGCSEYDNQETCETNPCKFGAGDYYCEWNYLDLDYEAPNCKSKKVYKTTDDSVIVYKKKVDEIGQKSAEKSAIEKWVEKKKLQGIITFGDNYFLVGNDCYEYEAVNIESNGDLKISGISKKAGGCQESLG